MSGLSEDELLTPVPQGRYAKGVIKREAILDAALEVFSQVGFQGSTLREIARKCGVSHQSLMHYFPSKQELPIAAVTAVVAGMGILNSFRPCRSSANRNCSSPCCTDATSGCVGTSPIRPAWPWGS